MYKILSMGHLISVPSLVYRFIGLQNDSYSNTEWSKHNLLKTAIKNVSNNKFFVRSNLVRYKLQNTNSIHHHSSSFWFSNKQHYLSKTVSKLYKTTYVITRNTNITTTRLVLFVSVSTPFLRASSWAPGTVAIYPRRYSLQRLRTASAGCACNPWYECEKPYSR